MAYQTNTNHYESTLYIVDDSGNSPYTTIQSAIDAANTAGIDATVFIRAGDYTEDLTFYDGITLKGYTNLETVLTGVHTPPNSGTIKISDMGMASATDIITSAAAGTTNIYFENCEFNCTNGFICDLANWTGDINIYLCNDISTACGVVNNAATAAVSVENCVVGVGNGNTFTMDGLLSLDNTTVGCPIALSGTAISTAGSGCLFQDTFTISADVDLGITNSHFSTGANTAFSTTSTVTAVFTNVGIDSSNVAAIGGTGTVQFTSVSYDDVGDNAVGVVEDLTGTFKAGIIIAQEIQLGTALTIASGGTNASSMTNTYGVNYFDGTRLVTSTVGTATHVLTSNGAGVAPTFQVSPGAGSVESVTGGTNISASGTAADPVIDLDAAITAMTSITMADTGSLQTTTTDTDTMLIQGYDVDGTAYVPFITITNANVPTCDLNTGVTLGTKYIYRADGTDVPVADGGTGASTFTDHGFLIGSAAGAITALAEATDGQLPIGDTGADPVLATITAGTGITVTNAAGSITVAATGTTALNDQTGTTYTLVLTDAGKFLTFTNASAIAVTVPTNASVAFPIGTQIGFQQGGAGQATFAGAAPPTLKSADDAYTTVKLYSCGALIKIATDVWAVAGDLEA